MVIERDLPPETVMSLSAYLNAYHMTRRQHLCKTNDDGNNIFGICDIQYVEVKADCDE